MNNPIGPLAIANLMAGAAHKKAQAAPVDPDSDNDSPEAEMGIPSAKKPKQVAAAKEKEAGKKPLSGPQEGAIKAKNKAAMK